MDSTSLTTAPVAKTSYRHEESHGIDSFVLPVSKGIIPILNPLSASSDPERWTGKIREHAA